MQECWIKSPVPFGGAVDFCKTIGFCGVKRATAYVTAVGVYNLYVDGKKVGDAVLAPGWTSVQKMLQYQEYDITELIGEKSDISVRLARGWTNCLMGYKRANDIYHANPALLINICLEYEDGRTEVVCGDSEWEVYTTPVLFSDIYDGETVDLNAERRFLGNARVDSVEATLLPQIGEFVCEKERVKAARLIITPKGERVIDFGQNLAGYVEIKVKGNHGDKISISHAEVLDKYGNFYTDNYRTAKNICTYTLSGGDDVFKPSFTFQGYRYIRLDEWPFDDVDINCFTSVAVYSDMKRTGYFECGNEKINKLYSNIIWGQRSNFVDIPTDCPQRDERLGWTGDAQVFCRTACINYDAERFFDKWLYNMSVDQFENGAIFPVIPYVKGCSERVSAAWADACVIVPMEVYAAYGNKALLERCFPMMEKWVNYIRAFGDEEYLWIGGYHYGDWLAMDAGEGEYRGATQTDLIASAYFAYSTSLLIKAGKILGKDVTEYEKLLVNIKAAFRNAFMADGMPVIYPKADAFDTKRKVSNMTQTAIVLILKFGLYEGEAERKALADKLVELIRANGNRMTTGFVGTPYILHALSENGYSSVAYDLLLQEKNPSWLFSVNHGATTMWEHWDSVNDNGDFWSTDMNSFNHYAYGSVYDWIFGASAGIKVAEDGVGYAHVNVQPHPDRRLGHVACSIQTRGGLLSSKWSYKDDGSVEYEIVIPNGCKADVLLPSGKRASVGEGKHVFCEKE